MLYLVMILACAGAALAWSVDDPVTMAGAGVVFLVAAVLKIGVRTFGKYYYRELRKRAAWQWPHALHDPERLVQLSRGELVDEELLATLQHLEECDECAGKFRVIVMLRAGALENHRAALDYMRGDNGDPRGLM